MTKEQELLQAQSRAVNAALVLGKERLYLGPEALRDFRTDELRKLLKYARENSPWYAKTLADFDLDAFVEEDLADVPALDKHTLMENWDQIVTDRSLSLDVVESHLEGLNKDSGLLRLLDRFHVLATGGTTGTRGVYVYDWDGWSKRNAGARRFPLLDQNYSPVQINKSKLKLAQVVIMSPVFGMVASTLTYQDDWLESVYIPMTLPIAEVCSRLNDEQPDILMGIPSTVHKLCMEAEAGALNITPTIVWVSGEPLYGPVRKAIKRAWPSCHLFNVLASSEGVHAHPCHSDSDEMHLNDDNCIVQPVDHEGRPAALGERPAKLYVTNLYNYTLPLIRYESLDQFVFIDKTCPCGSNFQLIEAPRGRPEFDFVYPGGTFVHHLVFTTPLLLDRHVHEYQVCQTPSGAEVRIVSRGDADKDRLTQTMTNSLREVGLPSPEVTVREVSEFTYSQAGKLKRFVRLPEATTA